MNTHRSGNGLKTVITGACGFIGSNLIDKLLDDGFNDIVGVDNFSVAPNLEYLRRILRKRGDFVEREFQNGHSLNQGNCEIRIFDADILDAERMIEITSGAFAVAHLAAHTRVVESLKNPTASFETNSQGLFNVLEAVRNNRVERFIFASSNAAAGDQTPPIHEDMPPKPLSPYGASKLHGEALCSAYFNSYGLKTVALRFANAYGAYSEHKTSVIAEFLRKSLRGDPLTIYGDGNQTRDFINARDIARAIITCLSFPDNKTPQPWGETFQIATGVETRIIDLARLIEKNTGNPIKVNHATARRGEISRNYSDTSKASNILGFKANISFVEGLEQMLIETRT